MRNFAAGPVGNVELSRVALRGAVDERVDGHIYGVWMDLFRSAP